MRASWRFLREALGPFEWRAGWLQFVAGVRGFGRWLAAGGWRLVGAWVLASLPWLLVVVGVAAGEASRVAVGMVAGVVGAAWPIWWVWLDPRGAFARLPGAWALLRRGWRWAVLLLVALVVSGLLVWLVVADVGLGAWGVALLALIMGALWPMLAGFGGMLALLVPPLQRWLLGPEAEGGEK